MINGRVVRGWKAEGSASWVLRWPAILSALVVVLAAPGASFAQTVWTAGTGNWNTPLNWSAGVPTGSTVATITNGGTAQVTAAGAASIQTILGNSAMQSGTLSVSGLGELTTGPLAVGNSGTGSLLVQGGGSVTSSAASIGVNSTGIGTVTIDGNGSLWTNAGDMFVGSLGTGSLTLQSGGTVSTNNLSIKSFSSVNLNGGTLRFNTVGGTGGLNQLFYAAGTIQLAGNRNFFSDSAILTLFGATPAFGSTVTISNGKSLAIEGIAQINATTVRVNGGALTSLTSVDVGISSSNVLEITNGGTVSSIDGLIGGLVANAQSHVTVSDAGSAWNNSGNLFVGKDGGSNPFSSLTVNTGATVFVGQQLKIVNQATLNLHGGAIRFDGYSRDANANIGYTAGTVQLAGNRTIGSDVAIQDFFGASPTIPTGKALVVEGTATLAASAAMTLSGGTLSADTVLMMPGSQMITNTLTTQVSGAMLALAGSVIDTTGANLTVGDATKVNGFYGNGSLQVGQRTVTLADANDAVLDSAALATLGSVGSPGTLNAANGLTLDFGGNVTGFGTVSTPNDVAKPLINNGHITGNSVAQPITLTGYVKGVGTFNNVNITGTFSPGLSPTRLTVGNVALSPTSTLIMELGGTAAGSSYDQIQSSGALAFDGTLLVSIINGFPPAAGQSFNLFDLITTSGMFDTLALPTLAGLAWNTSQLYSDGVLSLVTAVGLAGDYNQDGRVNAADYTVWRNNLGSVTSLPNDDTAGVAADDYTRWKANFGQSAGNGSGGIANAAVPEPAMLILLILAAAGLCLSRRRAA